MKRIKTTETMHSQMPIKFQIISKVCEEASIYFTFKLADRMEERNLTVRALAEITGLRLATISDLMTGKKQSINLHHILILMIALRITELTDLISIEFPKNKQLEFKKDRDKWINEAIMPSGTMDLRAFMLDDDDLYIKYGKNKEDVLPEK